MFLDHASITVEGGKGGDGCIAFRREKYVAKGGPNGGDGGRGGNVEFLVDSNTDTLSLYASCKKFTAPKGGHGLGSMKNGKAGPDLELLVPPGTLVKDGDTGEVIFDLTHHGQRVVIANGGKGGFGNMHFKGATRQVPRFAEKGEPGEVKQIDLELKLVADVGIIGFPSVGKSTLISVVSSARPKIASYEFTTLVPNLGVTNVGDRSFVLCDIPGLIEGASDGKGLGLAFLKHIERCGLLLHVLDIQRHLHVANCKLQVEGLISDYKAIRNELEKYSETLALKKEVVVLNKIDLLPEEEVTTLVDGLKAAGIDVFATISTAQHKGTEELMQNLWPIVSTERTERLEREKPDDDEIPVLKPHEDSHRMQDYTIDESQEGVIRVVGKRIEQFTVMTDFGNEQATQRFRDVIDRIGLKKALESLDIENKRVEIRGINVSEHV